MEKKKKKGNIQRKDLDLLLTNYIRLQIKMIQ